jgi:hypothetical protein
MPFKIEIFHDISEAKKWWNFFSPHESIYDEWDFRFCFYKYFKNQIFFYVGYLDDQPVGLLPLQRNLEENYLEAFGTFFMRQNRVYIDDKYAEFVPLFFKNIELPIQLSKLIGANEFIRGLPFDYNQYVLDISEYKNYQELFEKNLSSKHRTDLKRQIKLTEKAGNIDMVINNFEDINELIRLNKLTFGEDSSFYKPFREQIFKDFFKLPFQFRVLSFKCGGHLAAVSLGVFYGNEYVFINAGVDRSLFPHINTYVNAKMVDDAIVCGAKIFDAGLEDLGWKEKWGFTKIPQYKFENNIK